MTIERTREIFGYKMDDYSDADVLEFITQMSIIGDDLLSNALSQLTSKSIRNDTKEGRNESSNIRTL